MKHTKTLVALALVILLGLAATKVFSLNLRGPKTITVTGQAQQTLTNEIAQYYASVRAEDPDKQAALNEVNQQMNALIAQLEQFGIAETDIETQSVSVYENRERPTEFINPPLESVQLETEQVTWMANNSVQIKLRDVSRSSELIDVLSQSGVTDMSGPNFMLDQSTKISTDLLNQAVNNAREKAVDIAAAQDKKVVDVLSISEGYQASPIMMRAAVGFGGANESADVRPGSSTQEATVTVVFEIR